MATSKELRDKIVSTYLTRQSKNQYTQGNDRKYFFGKPTDGKPGWSDCSSSWRETYKRVIGQDIGGNTAAQIVNKKLIEVCLQKGGQPANVDKMLPGDLLYFKGSDASRPFGVGHVEGYLGNGKIAGHGGGTGPRVTNMKDYCASRYKQNRGLIKVLRVIPLDGSDSIKPAAPATPTTNTYELGFGARVLKFGMSGSDVKALQTALLSLTNPSYSLGKWGADGDFGTATKNAVIAYQKANKLEADGVVGEKTRLALEKALPETGDDAEDTATPAAKKIVKISEDVYIRTKSNTNGSIIGVAKAGATYPWAEETSPDGWQRIIVDAQKGWVSGKYAKLQ